MEFEFDPVKSEANKLKHNIDLIEAQQIWLDPEMIEGPGRSISELRWIAVGKIRDLHWTACFTLRGEKIRLIECRRARREESEVYELSK